MALTRADGELHDVDKKNEKSGSETSSGYPHAVSDSDFEARGVFITFTSFTVASDKFLSPPYLISLQTTTFCIINIVSVLTSMYLYSGRTSPAKKDKTTYI
jgi:hypothetical protein